jgi:hypothetical protein
MDLITVKLQLNGVQSYLRISTDDVVNTDTERRHIKEVMLLYNDNTTTTALRYGGHVLSMKIWKFRANNTPSCPKISFDMARTGLQVIQNKSNRIQESIEKEKAERDKGMSWILVGIKGNSETRFEYSSGLALCVETLHQVSCISDTSTATVFHTCASIVRLSTD